MNSKYILDTNIFITAKNKWYPFDLFPSFWNQIIDKAEQGMIYICDEIYNELLSGDDELSLWIKQNKEKFNCLKSDELKTIAAYSEIINNVAHNKIFKESAKREFAEVADSWIIAHAKANNLVIVTQETRVDFNCKQRVKIPNICYEFGIEYIDIIEFMRRTNFRF